MVVRVRSSALGTTALKPTKPATIAVLEAYPGGVRRRGRSQIVQLRTSRLGSGAVQRAAARAMVHRRSMKLADIHAEIEALLGRVVSYSSVEWCLRMGCRGEASRFERVGVGRYRLRRG